MIVVAVGAIGIAVMSASLIAAITDARRAAQVAAVVGVTLIVVSALLAVIAQNRYDDCRAGQRGPGALSTLLDRPCGDGSALGFHAPW